MKWCGNRECDNATVFHGGAAGNARCQLGMRIVALSHSLLTFHLPRACPGVRRRVTRREGPSMFLPYLATSPSATTTTRAAAGPASTRVPATSSAKTAGAL